MSIAAREVPFTKAPALRSVEAPTQNIALERVVAGPCPRARGLDADHVRTLAELDGQWPPIVINRADGRVVDGHHRLAAARSLGMRSIPAVYYEGPPEATFVEFVRRNVEHGLPLTLAERREAATRILRACSDWSDRRVAKLCALSPRTVATLRPPARSTDVERRIGADGRARPSDPAKVRRAIADVLEARPSASLRAVAEEVGASPETVRSVRRRLEAANTPSPAPAVEIPTQPVRPESRWWTNDSSLTSTGEGRQLAQWLSRSNIDNGWATHLKAAPLSRVYDLATEARRRAASWVAFAEALEAKAQARTS